MDVVSTWVPVTEVLSSAELIAARLEAVTPVTPAWVNVLTFKLPAALFAAAPSLIASKALAKSSSTVDGVVLVPLAASATVSVSTSRPAELVFSAAVLAPATSRDWVLVLTVPRLPVTSMPAATSSIDLVVPLVLPMPDSEASTAPYFSAVLVPSVVLKLLFAVPLAVTVVTGVVVKMLSSPRADATAALAVVTSVVVIDDLPATKLPSLDKPALSAAMVVTGLILAVTVPLPAMATAINTVSRSLAFPVASSM